MDEEFKFSFQDLRKKLITFTGATVGFSIFATLVIQFTLQKVSKWLTVKFWLKYIFSAFCFDSWKLLKTRLPSSTCYNLF